MKATIMKYKKIVKLQNKSQNNVLFRSDKKGVDLHLKPDLVSEYEIANPN